MEEGVPGSPADGDCAGAGSGQALSYLHSLKTVSESWPEAILPHMNKHMHDTDTNNYMHTHTGTYMIHTHKYTHLHDTHTYTHTHACMQTCRLTYTNAHMHVHMTVMTNTDNSH